jgi:hypothetical protein
MFLQAVQKRRPERFVARTRQWRSPRHAARRSRAEDHHGHVGSASWSASGHRHQELRHQ